MRTPPPLVGIPIKPFGVAKLRLDPRIDAAARSRLGKAIAAHTLQTFAAVESDVVVVTSDPGVTAWAADLGFGSIDELAGGLNGAAAALRDRALDPSRSWLVVHADLPALAAADVVALHDSLAGGAVVAPSYDGGTTALGSDTHVDFAYGPGSVHRHLRRAPHSVVLVRPGLSFDLDTVADLDSALNSIPWLAAALDSAP